MVSVGAQFACGLRESGEIECWGYQFEGQAQPPAGKHVQVSAGETDACALSIDGTLSCWMIYSGPADVPARLRAGGLPVTGTGGLLDGGSSAAGVGVAALAALGVSILSLLVVLARRQRRM